MSTTMQFGASLDVRFDESVEEFVRFLGEQGLSHVELRKGYLDVRSDPPSPDRLRRIADDHGVTYTVHMPHRDCNLGNQNERLRRASVEAVEESLDLAADIEAGGVVVHGGSVRTRYPERAQEHGREQAVRSIRECINYAEEVEVPVCLENQRDKPSSRRNTAVPDRIAAFADDIGIDSEYFRFTLDVGHAKATGVPYEAFVERFGDRIHVAHLHDNDGTGDDHDPLPEFRAVADEIGAEYNVFEMKSLDDIRRCVSGGS
nr:sugar phosphate isomerase/epimerase [Haladaptatus paucihalophilus]